MHLRFKNVCLTCSVLSCLPGIIPNSGARGQRWLLLGSSSFMFLGSSWSCVSVACQVDSVMSLIKFTLQEFSLYARYVHFLQIPPFSLYCSAWQQILSYILNVIFFPPFDSSLPLSFYFVCLTLLLSSWHRSTWLSLLYCLYFPVRCILSESSPLSAALCTERTVSSTCLKQSVFFWNSINSKASDLIKRSSFTNWHVFF